MEMAVGTPGLGTRTSGEGTVSLLPPDADAAGMQIERRESALSPPAVDVATFATGGKLVFEARRCLKACSRHCSTQPTLLGPTNIRHARKEHDTNIMDRKPYPL